MNRDHKAALERIAAVCLSSRELTHRTLRILDITYEGLGMTANQREFEISRLRKDRIEAKRNAAKSQTPSQED